MHEYKVPATGGMGPSGMIEDKAPAQLRIYVPVGPEYLAKFKVGQEVSVTLRGKVVALESCQDEKQAKSELGLAVDTTTVDPVKKSKANPGETEEDEYGAVWEAGHEQG